MSCSSTLFRAEFAGNSRAARALVLGLLLTSCRSSGHALDSRPNPQGASREVANGGQWSPLEADARRRNARPEDSRVAPGELLLADTAELVRWLQAHNAGVLAQASRVEQARSDLGQSGLYPDPSVNFGLGGVNVGAHNPPDLSRSQSQNYTVGVEETFEIGKRGPRVDAARLRLDAESQRYESLLGDTTTAARLALVRSIYLTKRSALLDESLTAAKQLLDVQRSRLDHGDISRNDFDRLTLDTTLLELEAPKTRAELEGALADVRTLLGTDAVLGAPEPDVLAKAGAFDLSLVDVDDAIANRADHAALTLDMRAAEKDAVLARRKAIPDPQVGLSYMHDNLTEAGNQADTLALTLGIDVPLFDRGQHTAQKAIDHAFEIAHTREESMREARAEATTLLERQRALEGILVRLAKEALPTSSEVLDATTTAFNRGELKLADVLLTQRTHIDLVLKNLDLQFESFSVRNDLRRVLGLDSAIARDVNERK